MTYDEITRSLDEARWLMMNSDRVAAKAIEIASGRLRQLSISNDILRSLKRELAGYNIHTGRWKK